MHVSVTVDRMVDLTDKTRIFSTRLFERQNAYIVFTRHKNVRYFISDPSQKKPLKRLTYVNQFDYIIFVI